MVRQCCTSLAQALFSTIVVLFFYIRLTLSAAVRTESQKLNLTLSELSDRHCTDSPEWIGTGAQLDDCVAAVRLLHDTEIKIYGDLDVEFYSFDKTKARSTLSRPTPIKYTHGRYFPIGACAPRPIDLTKIHSYMHSCHRDA